MKVKIKKLHENAVVPKYAKDGDAGMDLTATSVEYNHEHGTIEYGIGLAIEIPKGYVGYIFPRSSQKKKSLWLTNHVGVVDSGYRGEIKFAFKPDRKYWCEIQDGCLDIKGEFHYHASQDDEFQNFVTSSEIYSVGDRVGQLIIMPYPKVEFEESEEISSTDRGSGGFGSSGA